MKRILTAAIAVILCITAVFAVTGCSRNTESNQPAETENNADDTTAGETETVSSTLSIINGMPVDDSEAGSRPVAIVVENHPSARPQWGFTTPATVVEYEVEGGITRMLWLYDSVNEVPDAVGPLRSARHDAVELAMGFDAIFIHIGGSTYAYDEIEQYSGSIDAIDGKTDESFHAKDTSRDVAYEHRSVLNGDKLAARLNELGIRQTTTEGSLFSFAPYNSPRTLTGISGVNCHIEYSGSYVYDYTYDSSENVYTGKINGTAITDENYNTCKYTNLLVLYAETVNLGDSSGHIDINLEKGGSGWYLSGGVAEQITWIKYGSTGNLQLCTADGTVLELNAGRTYIGFVRDTQSSLTSIS